MSTAHANTQQFRIFIYSLASDSYFLFFAPLSLPATCKISLKTYRDFMCMHNIYFFKARESCRDFSWIMLLELIFEREKCCSFQTWIESCWDGDPNNSWFGTVAPFGPSSPQKKIFKQQLVDSIITKKKKQIASRKPWKTLNASCLR